MSFWTFFKLYLTARFSLSQSYAVFSHNLFALAVHNSVYVTAHQFAVVGSNRQAHLYASLVEIRSFYLWILINFVWGLFELKVTVGKVDELVELDCAVLAESRSTNNPTNHPTLHAPATKTFIKLSNHNLPLQAR